MKVVVVQPSLEDFYTTPHRLSAMGGFSIKALLEKQGHSVTLLNFPLIPKKPRRKPLPEWAGHLTPHLLEEKGPVSYFSRWYRWGAEPEEAARLIHDENPGLILISLFAHAYGEEVFSLARACKAFTGDKDSVPVFAGGAGVTVRPELFTVDPHIDLVLAGEGEVLFKDYSLAELILMAGKGKRLIRADRYCSSDEMVPLFSVTGGGKTHVQAASLLSRGCPRGCRFCSNRLTQGERVRRLDEETVLEGFECLLRSPQLGREKKLTLDLEDDNLLMNKQYFLRLLREFRKRWVSDGRPEENLFFTAENGMDYELLTREILEELVSSGFRQFNFSLASADKKLLARENRFFHPGKLGEHLDYLKQGSIPSVTYFICGLEGDSRESAAEALFLLDSLPTRLGISLFYPVPGLEGFTGTDPLKGNPPGLARGSMAYPWNGSLSTLTLVTAFRLSRFINLLKDERAFRDHGDLIDLIRRENRLYTYDLQGKKIPVPEQDGELVSLVLGSLTYQRSC